MSHIGLHNSRSNLELLKELDKLRTELRLLEMDLQKFGFERNRGLETYSVKEIRQLAEKNKFSKNFTTALRKCLDKHLQFYSKLHGVDTFKPIKENVATANIWKINKWMLRPNREIVSRPPRKLPKSAKLLRLFFNELSRAKTSRHFDDWYDNVLRRTYKREYDIYRFVEFLANAYNNYIGSKALIPDHVSVRKGVEEILPAVARRKLTDNKFLSFLAKYINAEYPNLLGEEGSPGT